MRKGNTYRLPADLDWKNPEHTQLAVNIINQAFQSFQSRLDTIQQIGANTPPAVSDLTVTGKQGYFLLTWKRIVGVDGYVILEASTTSMTPITARYHVSDGQQASYQIPVGNVAVTAAFQIYAYQGTQYGTPSSAVSATTAVYGSSESAPVAPPINPQSPLVAPVRSGPNLP